MHSVEPEACHTVVIMARRKQANLSDLPTVSDFLDDVLAIGGASVDHRIRRTGSLNVSEQDWPHDCPLRPAKNRTVRANRSQIVESEKSKTWEGIARRIEGGREAPRSFRRTRSNGGLPAILEKPVSDRDTLEDLSQSPRSPSERDCKLLILNGEMSEWSIEHAWKAISETLTERH